MSDDPEHLPDISADLAAGLPAEAAAIVRAYRQVSKADATVRAYTSDAWVFQKWCTRFGFRSLPASTEAVAAFIGSEAEEGRAASTLGRRLAAIRYAHKLAGATDSTEDEGVRAAIKGARRKVGVSPIQKAAATAEILAAVLTQPLGSAQRPLGDWS